MVKGLERGEESKRKKEQEQYDKRFQDLVITTLYLIFCGFVVYFFCFRCN
jgi:hypothetical protein